MDNTIPLLIERDPVFAAIINQYGPPVFQTRPEGFESLCRTILEQQVSLESARASYRKLLDLMEVFDPQHMLLLTDAQLRESGVSRQKASYLRALAAAVADGTADLGNFRQKTAEQVRAELIKIKGIGNWTIDVYLMFSLQSPDILPLGDIGILSAIKDLWGYTIMADIISHTKNWSPYRTTASFMLWHYYLAKRRRTFPH